MAPVAAKQLPVLILDNAYAPPQVMFVNENRRANQRLKRMDLAKALP